MKAYVPIFVFVLGVFVFVFEKLCPKLKEAFVKLFHQSRATGETARARLRGEWDACPSNTNTYIRIQDYYVPNTKYQIPTHTYKYVIIQNIENLYQHTCLVSCPNNTNTYIQIREYKVPAPTLENSAFNRIPAHIVAPSTA